MTSQKRIHAERGASFWTVGVEKISLLYSVNSPKADDGKTQFVRDGAGIAIQP